MTTDTHIQVAAKAVMTTAPAALPGAGVLAAKWLDLINTGASIVFLILSAAYLVWRWRRDVVKGET